MDPLDSKLLDEGFLSYWATGNKSPLIRGRMIVRAPVLATQLMFVWTLPPIMLLWIIHMADTQGALRWTASPCPAVCCPVLLCAVLFYMLRPASGMLRPARRARRS